jgi:hypothetical protein
MNALEKILARRGFTRRTDHAGDDWFEMMMMMPTVPCVKPLWDGMPKGSRVCFMAEVHPDSDPGIFFALGVDEELLASDKLPLPFLSELLRGGERVLNAGNCEWNQEYETKCLWQWSVNLDRVQDFVQEVKVRLPIVELKLNF